MSRKRSLSLTAITLSLLASCIVGLPAAHAGVVSVRFAIPDGNPANSCAQASPCDLVTAINGANSDVEVVIEPGVYYDTHPLTTPLASLYSLTIHAADPGSPPLILTAANTGITLTNSNLSGMVLFTSGSGSGIELTGGSADHIAVFSSAGTFGACQLYGATLSDSVCAQSGANDPGIGISESGPGSDADVLRNVTAVSTGAGGYGIYAACGNIDFTVDATNTIFHGAGGDVYLSISGTGSTVLDANHSAYRPDHTDLTGGGQIVAGPGNVWTAPKFANTDTVDFRERPASPTVDAGKKVGTADVDLANLPRRIGRATDIGAFELPVAPKVKHLKVLNASHHSATIKVKVDGQGLLAERQVVATTKDSRVSGPTTTVRTPNSLKVTLHHLKRHRHYAVHVVAKSKGGTTTSKPKHLTTT